MHLSHSQPLMTASRGGAEEPPHWETMLRIQAQANAEAEVTTRRYRLSPKRTAGLSYDDRLTMRLGCGKTKAYELLKAYERKEVGGLRHKCVGNKYLVSEEAVREFFGDVAPASVALPSLLQLAA